MDGQRFDDWARRLAHVSSRRNLLKLIGGGVGALVTGGAWTGCVAAACRNADRSCSTDGQCCSGMCSPKNATGRRTCVCPPEQESCRGACKSAADYQTDPANCGSCQHRCPAPAYALATCAAGICDFACKNGYKRCGDACIAAGDCCTADECPDPVQPCEGAKTCTGGRCGFSPAPANTPCQDGSCLDGVAIAPAVCDGQRTTCPPGATTQCAPYLCNGAGTACRTSCDGDDDCVPGAHCDAPNCLPDLGLGQSCDENSDCENGHCVNGGCCAQDCPAPENGRATCSGNGLTCSFRCNSGFNTCGNGCCPSNQTCCNGACCPAGLACVGNACAEICLGLGAACTDGAACCGATGGGVDCQSVCDAESTCCAFTHESCSDRCDCCGVADCINGACCQPPGEECRGDDECCGGIETICHNDVCTIVCRPPDAPCEEDLQCCGSDKCINGRCRPEGCLPPGYSCSGPTECCQTEQTFCAVVNGSQSTCCHPIGGTCSQNFDCCGYNDCCNGVCCPSGQRCCNGTCCPIDRDCCAGACCAAGTSCCGGKTCCPDSRDCCNGTCCPAGFACINGACACLPAQSTCDPTNNQCCQDTPTICPEINLYGHRHECCRLQGAQCSTGSDCCYDIVDGRFGRDSCGTDGLCGGEGAYCLKLEDCLGHETAALSCIGICNGPGAGGLRYCVTSRDCPPIDGNPQHCEQQRCINFADLP